MKDLRLVVVALWFVVGLALATWGAWSVFSSWRYFNLVSGAFKSSVSLLAFAITAVVGAILAWRGRKVGDRALQACSALGILYAVIYFLFGGLEDAKSYLPGVIGLVGLSVATFGLAKVGPRDAT